MDSLAAGAMPEAFPKSTPRIFTCATGFPAAVKEVCVPWESPSRGESDSCGTSAGGPPGEVLAGLADAREGVAVGLLHRDAVVEVPVRDAHPLREGCGDGLTGDRGA